MAAKSCSCRRVQQPPLSAAMKARVAVAASQLVRSIDGLDADTARRLATDLARAGRVEEDGTIAPRKRRRRVSRG